MAGKRTRTDKHMAEIAGKQPTCADIMNFLSNINDKLSKMEDKLNAQSEILETLQDKVSNFESEIVYYGHTYRVWKRRQVKRFRNWKRWQNLLISIYSNSAREQNT